MLQLPLQYGPYNVGFKYQCIFDEGRFYQTYHPNQQTTLRPIPLNIWYPAQKTEVKSRMLYEDYWDFQSKDSVLTTFHQRLKNYNIEKAHLYFTGKEAANRTEEDEQYFQRLRQSRVMSTRDAPKIEQAFPMIVYHQGLDAHIEDNVLMLEYLASWGYVIVSSSYHSMDAKSMTIDWDVKRSVADIELILQYQKRQFNVKNNQIVLMGHSFGAQAMMSFVGEKYGKYDNKLKALVLLDSTIDYAFCEKSDRCLRVVSKLKNTQFQTPTLAFARLSATFELLNQLQSTHRYYCKIGHLLHNDFISIGATAATFRSKKSQDEFAVIWRNYQQICVFVHHFLEAFVKDNPKSKWLFEKENFEKQSQDSLQCEQLAQGVTTRPFIPYSKESLQAPTFEQLVDLIQREGREVFDELYKRFPDAPIFTPVSVEELGEYFLHLEKPNLVTT